jgi:uncharacterized membrane protein
LRPVSPPGNFLVTFACGVNNLGEIVGFTSNGGARGFAFKHGQYEIVNIHNAKETEPLGINDDGIIVGFEITGGRGIRGFALKDKNHVSLMVPGSVATFAMGLNASGEVVGGYTSDNNLYHGFVSSSVSGLFQRGTGR